MTSLVGWMAYSERSGSVQDGWDEHQCRSSSLAGYEGRSCDAYRLKGADSCRCLVSAFHMKMVSLDCD